MTASALSIFVFLIICQTTFSAKNCPILYHGIEGHTACVSESPLYISGGVSNSEKETILQEHNKFRAGVSPPACNMLKLYWDDDMAYVADRWARHCSFNHDRQLNRSIPGSFSVGQNLGYAGYVIFRTKTPWQFIMRNWEAETKYFTYDKSTNVYSKVGHYVQLVWETAQVVGCGYAHCKGFELYVCNYGPGINYLKRNRPYEKCAKSVPLKDCKGKLCKNEGLFKKGSCECECPAKNNNLYGPECSLNCAVKDSSRCKNKNSCAYFNVPPDCPKMCGTCPYLDQAKKADTKTMGPGISGVSSPTDKDSTTSRDTDITFVPNDGAVAFKYSGMSVLLLLVIFISNQLLQ